ncbi:hypothetical protein AX14_006619 [Amanita brunnescens Koide BX004]|nr:hypothetical protein AX14_006619 [Amanita brunnescens Koide BX004]
METTVFFHLRLLSYLTDSHYETGQASSPFANVSLQPRQSFSNGSKRILRNLVIAACCYVAAKAEECSASIKVVASEARAPLSQDNYNVKSTLFGLLSICCYPSVRNLAQFVDDLLVRTCPEIRSHRSWSRSLSGQPILMHLAYKSVTAEN